MTLFDFCNPSDPYTFECDDLEVAAAMVLELGSGKASANPIGKDEDDPEKSIPMFMFASKDVVDVWFKDNFKRTLDESLEYVLKNKLPELISCYESFVIGNPENRVFYFKTLEKITLQEDKEKFIVEWIDDHCSSLNDFQTYARKVAVALKKKLSDDKIQERDA